MRNEAQNFWKFSLQLYNRAGVADACLELQNSYQLDVNLLLFCYWYAEAYGELDEELLQDVLAFSSQWRTQVVQPLRDTRSWMKRNSDSSEEFEGLREQIKADELRAEKFQQERIASLASIYNEIRESSFGSRDCDKNIESLLKALEVEKDESLESRLEIIRRALTG